MFTNTRAGCLVKTGSALLMRWSGAPHACRLTTMHPVNSAKGGRPRLDMHEGLMARLSGVLPRLRSGDISQRRAATELGISARSLMRYARRMDSGRPNPTVFATTPEIEAIRRRSSHFAVRVHGRIQNTSARHSGTGICQCQGCR
jgi:hypothetical protein